MIKKFTVVFSVFALLICLGTAAFGQETTGSIEVTVKDPNGAVVPSVSITVASSDGAGATTGFKRSATTDNEGFVRVIQVPPGLYTVTAAATSGFAEKTVPGVQVTLGKATGVNVALGVSGVDPTTVTVNSTDVAAIDTTDTKIQTNISAQTAELLPKGTNFASVLKVSPATRPEPLSGQFQIDGASGSENTFIIDGQEVTNARTGTLDANSNLPFQLIQEIQVKSSGFEAEYGGATGGVINLVTKGGSNTWRGEIGSQFEPSSLQARGVSTLFLNTRNAPPGGRADYFPLGKDKYLGFYPTASLGGPIFKDRLWFYSSYTPQIFNRQRTINYIVGPNASNPFLSPFYAPQTYKAKQTSDYTFLRLDAQPLSKIRLNAAYTWNPIAVRGAIPTYFSAREGPLTQAGSTLSGAAFLNQTGGRQNSQSITGQATWTVTNNFFINARAGHYFLNEKLGSYGVGDVHVPWVLCSAQSSVAFPAGFGCAAGFTNNLPLITVTAFDATARNTIDADATYLFSMGGRHEFKGGYQYNGLSNKLLSDSTDQIVFRYGWAVGNYAGNTGIVSTPGAVGAGLLRQFREQGDVSSANKAFYIQDKWQPINRLTFNLGIRAESENVPSFTPSSPDLKFGWGDKLAPRLGVAFDLTGDGKTKVSAFYGWFYDRFKYELPRGSFGGQFYHDFYFEIFPGDTRANLTSAVITGGGQPTPGGSCPEGTTTPIIGRIRCDIDYRIPSNSGLGIFESGAVDENIKAFRQSEFTITFERDLGRNFLLAGRYTRKNVEVAIEDAGFQNEQGSEAYIIGNPGLGLYREVAEDLGYIGTLKPQRRYDAVEVRFDRRLANNYYFNLNYTWSRLFGNYSGLASSDEDGRLSPNVNRFFDLPFAGYTAAGGPDNGVLPTDRTHAVKFNGAYILDWDKRLGFGKNNQTEFGVFTTFQSGTPVTSVVDIYNIDTVVLTKRGDLGRTGMFSQTDFSIRHRMRFGKDSRFTLVVEADALNVFNEANEVNRINLINTTTFDLRSSDIGLLTADEIGNLPGGLQRVLAIRRFQESGAPNLIDLAEGAGKYPLYNFPSAFQAPREIRFGIRLLF
ncbi:MAG: carboxypeptidase regulatory-like domain-containing protein [Pyrinomonadaceae bacterium]